MNSEKLRLEISRLLDKCNDEAVLLKVAKLLHEHAYENPVYDETTQCIFIKYDNLFRRLADS